MPSKELTLAPVPVNVPAPLADRIVNGVRSIAGIVGTEESARRLLTQALVAVQRNPTLLNADPDSFMLAVATVGQWGLDIGTTAHLVPFKNSRTGRTLVTAIADYKGMIALVVASRAARSVEARVVYQGEAFAVHYGTDARIDHVPDFGKQGNPANITHAYAIARHGFNAAPSFVVLTRAEIEARRAASRNRDGDTWTKQYPAMAKKSAVRALAPMLPQTPRLAAVIAAEEYADAADAEPTPARPAPGEPPAGAANGATNGAAAEPSLEDAGAFLLPGGPRSWGGYGGMPLAQCRNNVLRGVVRWCDVQKDAPNGYQGAATLGMMASMILAAREQGALEEPPKVDDMGGGDAADAA